MSLAPANRENVARQTGTAFTQPSVRPQASLPPQPHTTGYPPGKITGRISHKTQH
jgi:hypothetical protein